MAKIDIIQSNFSSGELTPRIALGRMDIAKFQNGSRRQENIKLTVQGGARRRGGSRVVCETKASGVARIIEFIYNRDQAFVLELGNLYMRFVTNRAQIMIAGPAPYEIASPYTTAQLADIAFVQGEDTMFLVHPDVKPYRLQRFGNTNWRLLPVPFTVEPFDELGIAPAAALTIASIGVGVGVNFAAPASFFAADVGRDIVAGSGLATVTAYVDVNNVTCEIKAAFPGLVTASGAWTILGSPQATLTSSAVGPVGQAVTASLSAAGWRAVGEVGKYIKINGGLIKVTGYTSSTVLAGIVQQVLTSVVGAIPNSWSLNSSIWGGANGYPRAVTLHEQRLLLGGQAGSPQTITGSLIGDFINFELGTKDDEAFSYKLSTSQVAPIQHLTESSQLIVLTTSNEMSVRGGVEKTITPTNIQKKDGSTAGSSNVRPVKVGNEVMFVQRAGRKVRAIGYKYDIDGFASPDRTVFAEHITKTGIIDMAFQQEPDALLYCPRADGVMAVCAYDVEQEVVGWGRWITQGKYESVANVPTTDAEDLYTVTSRVIGGVTKRFIEVFDDTIALDACFVGTVAGPGQAVWAGLGYLEGMTVQCLADGAYMGAFVVTGGQITLPRNALSVQIGLSYTALIEPLQIEIAQGGSTIQGNAINVSEVVLRVLDTKAIVFNGDPIDPREFGPALLDQPPPDFKGDVQVASFTDQIYKTKQVITQPYPLPFHLLNIIRKVTVNG